MLHDIAATALYICGGDRGTFRRFLSSDAAEGIVSEVRELGGEGRDLRGRGGILIG